MLISPTFILTFSLILVSPTLHLYRCTEALQVCQLCKLAIFFASLVSSMFQPSTSQVHSSIASLPTVLQVQPQKVLSRVKRQGGVVFISPSPTFHLPSVFSTIICPHEGWRDERELAVREQCFVSTIGTQDSPSRRCVFPFEYKVFIQTHIL